MEKKDIIKRLEIIVGLPEFPSGEYSHNEYLKDLINELKTQPPPSSGEVKSAEEITKQAEEMYPENEDEGLLAPWMRKCRIRAFREGYTIAQFKASQFTGRGGEVVQDKTYNEAGLNPFPYTIPNKEDAERLLDYPEPSVCLNMMADRFDNEKFIPNNVHWGNLAKDLRRIASNLRKG